MRQKILQILTIIFVMLVMGFSPASAQEAPVPQITMFYPGDRPEAPLELKRGAKAYIYFASGSNVEYCKVRIMQDGNALGSAWYRRSTSANVTMMDTKLEENAALNLVAPGLFSLEVYEVKYTVDGQEYTYSDIDNPIGSVTYSRTSENGTIVAETGHLDRLIKSYYPAEGAEGVKTYTFSKPVDGSNIHAYFSYGYGDNMYLTPVPWNLSAEGLTLTVDFRGKCYNVDALAPGVTFYDVTGEPIAPPDAITLVVENLRCTDGSVISSLSVSLDGSISATVDGKIHQNYNYIDITFPTPELVSAEFFDSSAPMQKYPELSASTDMVNLTIENLSYIKQADVMFVAGSASATVPFAEINASSKIYCVRIPEIIRNAGANNLAISLENVIYVIDDGATHVIKPLRFGDESGETYSLAALKACDENTAVTLNVAIDGVKVTLSKAGFIFMEDATDGIQVITADFNTSLKTGTIVRGKFTGTYLGYGIFLIDESKSEFTAEDIDVSTGAEIDDIDAVIAGEYDNRLLTFSAEKVNIAYDEEIGVGVIDNRLSFILDLVEDAKIPDEITSITGIVYYDSSLSQRMIIVRSQDDIQGVTNSLGSITTNLDAQTIYNLNGIRTSLNTPGIYIINGKKVLIRK